MTFEATHVVPDGGVEAWDEPDGSQPAAANLHAGTELQVTEERGDWVKVAAENGWSGWVDARRLVARGSVPATTSAAVAPSRTEISLPEGVALSTAGRRLGAYALDAVLFFVTLIIGWVIWSFVAYKRGQTPAKQLLDMRVYHLAEARAASWGRMFVREWIGKTIVGIVASATVVGIILYFWLLWDAKRQQLWDKIVDTVVIDDPRRLLAPSA